jgi:hypothetical protein
MLKFETYNCGVIAIVEKKYDLQLSKVKVTAMVHYFNNIELYLQNQTRENSKFFLVDTSWYTLSDETIKTGVNR